MMANDAANIVKAVLAAGRAGDVAACKLVLDRLAPPRRAQTEFHLPPVRTAADVPVAMAAVLRAVAAGHLAPDEGAAVCGMIEAVRRGIETAVLAERIEALERRTGS